MPLSKDALEKEVHKIVEKSEKLSSGVAKSEVQWFFHNMGIDQYYFLSSPQEIASHILTLHAWKILHDQQDDNQKEEGVRFGIEKKDSAMFACRSTIDQDSHFNPDSAVGKVEQYIETNYLLEGYRAAGANGKDVPFRMRSYRTTGTISKNSDQQLRFYFLQRPVFKEGKLAEGETRLAELADREFFEKSTENTRAIYQDLLVEAMSRTCNNGPLAKVVKSTAGDHEARMVVAYKRGTTHSFFTELTTLYDNARMYAHKKAVTHFKNGWSIISVHLRPLNPSVAKDGAKVFAHAQELANQASFTFVLPRTSLSSLRLGGKVGIEEVTYLFCAWKFAFHFFNRNEEEYGSLLKSLEGSPDALRHLYSLRASLRTHTFSESRLLDNFMSDSCRPMMSLLFQEFKRKFDPALAKPLSAQEDKALDDKIIEVSRTEFERETYMAMRNFNKHILKTNFYKKSKLGLSFRLDPMFLDLSSFPVRPFGVFFFIGAEYRGFHIRFADIARGGLRLIKSRNADEYVTNVEGVFEENYNLALTQQRKNKDIPEGGSKGTILLTQGQQGKSDIAFLKYIDSMLDLLLVDPTEVVDYYKNQEILFCGPDENTANYMDLAAFHARSRGYKYWRAFTTGKSISMGGIPHDMFGMTTRSVHQCVLGCLRKLGKKEEDVTKLQTGGPDGDLGCNEILISKDKTIGIVDGSGVLYDPNGINRSELERLAKARAMVDQVEVSKLGASAQLVLLKDRDIKLKNGTPVQSGLSFRNNFHLSPESSADVFVPCGGRPNSVTVHNVEKLLTADGKPRFPIIVEGANLFFTQDARLRLEAAGGIHYKDASANKGGVTSSSCEVLACLALSEDEHKQCMQVAGNDPKNIPPFYREYVKSVQDVIESNARMEFEVIWSENEKTGVPRCLLTDRVSMKINVLNDALVNSKLWERMELRKKVVEAGCPAVLVKKLGAATILERVPDAYVRAIFGSYLASRYVYKYGLNASEFEFFDFINEFIASPSKL